MDDLGGNYHYFSETPTWIPYQFVASPQLLPVLPRSLVRNKITSGGDP